MKIIQCWARRGLRGCHGHGARPDQARALARHSRCGAGAAVDAPGEGSAVDLGGIGPETGQRSGDARAEFAACGVFRSERAATKRSEPANRRIDDLRARRAFDATEFPLRPPP